MPTLIERASAKLRQEQAIMAEIDGGAARQDWLHGTLRRLGLEMGSPPSSSSMSKRGATWGVTVAGRSEEGAVDA